MFLRNGMCIVPNLFRFASSVVLPAAHGPTIPIFISIDWKSHAHSPAGLSLTLGTIRITRMLVSSPGLPRSNSFARARIASASCCALMFASHNDSSTNLVISNFSPCLMPASSTPSVKTTTVVCGASGISVIAEFIAPVHADGFGRFVHQPKRFPSPMIGGQWLLREITIVSLTRSIDTMCSSADTLPSCCVYR